MRTTIRTALLMALMFSAIPAGAASQPVSVVVVAEDSLPGTIRRDSDAMRRVLAALQDGLARKGFAVLDGGAVARAVWELGPLALDKAGVLKTVVPVNRSLPASEQARVLALVRVHVDARSQTSHTQIGLRADGELFDLQELRFLGAYEIPRRAWPVSKACGRACLVETAGDRAGAVAALLADVLGRKLEAITGGGDRP